MTQLLEDLARLSMCFLATEVPAVLPEASLNGHHFCVTDVFWNKVR